MVTWKGVCKTSGTLNFLSWNSSVRRFGWKYFPGIVLINLLSLPPPQPLQFKHARRRASSSELPEQPNHNSNHQHSHTASDDSGRRCSPARRSHPAKCGEGVCSVKTRLQQSRTNRQRKTHRNRPRRTNYGGKGFQRCILALVEPAPSWWCVALARTPCTHGGWTSDAVSSC